MLVREKRVGAARQMFSFHAGCYREWSTVLEKGGEGEKKKNASAFALTRPLCLLPQFVLCAMQIAV